MKRCIFVGPSLHGVTNRPTEIEFRPPAARGDVIRAVADGYRWIGLVDGYFGSCASVWHKEILYALSIGCHVWGAASMGALRAAECGAFGMRPVGQIALGFASGELNDDAEVALVHGPAEVDYIPFTEALVDVRATIAAMHAAHATDDEEASRLTNAARTLHFTERTVDAMTARAVDAAERRTEVEMLFEMHRVRAKRQDALQLVGEMRGGPPTDQGERQWQPVASASLLSLIRGGAELKSEQLATVTMPTSEGGNF